MPLEPLGLVLAGPPGVGKSTVGRLLAARLGLPFIDLDERVAAAAGLELPALFAREGEVGFRARERAAVAALEEGAAIVACGGGTLLDADNRRLLRGRGRLIGLTASNETLADRLRLAELRPLLAGGSLAELLADRQAMYDGLPWQVDTDGRSPTAVAEEVLGLLATLNAAGLRTDPQVLPVAAPPDPAEARGSRPGYAMLVGEGLLDLAGALLRARGLRGRIVVVSDRTVATLYGRRLLRNLAVAGLDARLVAVKPGEGSKSPATLGRLYRRFLAAGLDREGVVLALGGGVVGDLAGYAAGTWLRGVTLVQAPTSLLAMVDSAIGGKTGINLPAGKNLVGTFKQPAMVVADLSCLATLPSEILTAGLAEVVKAGIIADAGLLDLLAAGIPPVGDGGAWAQLVLRAARVKARIVARDPGERGQQRIHLNLGHTFAHGLEQASGFRLAHGQAVALGLVAAARLAERLGLLQDAGLPDRLIRLQRALGLPTGLKDVGLVLDGAAILAAMGRDKKASQGRLRLVLPRGLEALTVVDGVPADDVAAVLALL
ncbi:MAG: 3-dehydroquinate synthase [Anaerolineae bacterium]